MKVEERVEQVWNQHGFYFDKQACSCGEPLEDHDEAELHFYMEVYKAGYKDGKKRKEKRIW